MAKFLSVYNRLQAGDYENGNGGKRRVSRLTQFIHVTLHYYRSIRRKISCRSPTHVAAQCPPGNFTWCGSGSSAATHLHGSWEITCPSITDRKVTNVVSEILRRHALNGCRTFSRLSTFLQWCSQDLTVQDQRPTLRFQEAETKNQTIESRDVLRTTSLLSCAFELN